MRRPALVLRLSLVAVSYYCCSFTLAKVSKYSQPKLGGPCELSRLRKGIEHDKRHYLYCSPFQGVKNIWKQAKCHNNTAFVERDQRCRPVSRRQESLCRSQPNAFACPQRHCSAATYNDAVSPGSVCDWMTSPLQSYPRSQNYYLQCNPTSMGSPCGVWNQMQCTNGTSFNIYVQICITVALSHSSCLPNEVGLFSCGAGNWCPVGSVCRQGVCCQAFDTRGITTYPFPHTINPSTVYPPPVTAYPQPQTLNPYPQTINPYPQTFNPYPQTFNPYPQTVNPYPPQTANPFPQTFNPYPQTVNPYPPTPKPINPYPMTPATPSYSQPPINPYPQPPIIPYTQPPPINPYPQPFTEYPPVTFYPPFTQPPPVTLYPPGPPGYTPFITTPRGLPICSNGQLAETFCSDNSQCPNGYCYQGGCCPFPNCPSGSVATQYCKDLTDCLPNQFCFNNGCCPIPGCPNGETPTRSCDSNTPCPSSFTCQSGACCASSIADCPGPEPSSMPCSGPGTCPENQFCHLDSNGRHGCCPIPKCPNGMPAVQPCDRNLQCPAGLQCINNACCDMTSGITIYPPTPAPYPPIFTYYPTPVPPTLSPPVPQPNTCSGCCPVFQVAICFCASFNVCPQQTICGSQGACCASYDTASNYISKRPGEKCATSNECPGYREQTSMCREGNCVCINGAYSNGFTCVRHNDMMRRRRVKGQQGPQGRRVVVGWRRKRRYVKGNELDVTTIEKDNELEEEQQQRVPPLYWRTFYQSRCVTDNECIPEMICQNGTCQDAIIRLREQNCSYDEQCFVHTPFSECRPEHDKVLSSINDSLVDSRKVCQCEPGYFEFNGQCWKECPLGTKLIGNICVANEEATLERKFWLPENSLLTDSSFNASSLNNEELPVNST